MNPMPDIAPPFIRALLDPARYPHPVERVELVETHISWVLLAGAFAYKIKKPLTLPFLDYGTVEKRRAACSAEVRLNRRFAPQLYLGVVDFDGEPAVRMHRFNEQARLDHVCKRGALKPEHLSGLAATLARFHGAADMAAADSRFGTPAAVLDPALENFAELRNLTGTVFAADLDALERWTRGEFARLETDFAARKAGGFIREGHGDLHLGNMVLQDDAVTLFDCIEFNEDFRWIDVASELAFALVDLLDHGQPGLACWLLNEWLAETGDIKALGVLRFYMAYRALVRAKVAAIRACQQTAPGALHAADCPEVRDYMALARTIAVSRTPTFAITFGVSGSGKTTASTRRLLADPHAATIRLRSDVERKRLFGLGRHDASGSTLDAGIYTPEATTRTYARLAELADFLLGAGWSAIVDAAFLKREERAAFRAIAARHGVPFAILACEAPADELRRRVAARAGDASEATLAVLEKQLAWVEPLDDAERTLSVAG
jgi:aminoglycoside phosphotransferase family enzyme/predicted kinase